MEHIPKSQEWAFFSFTQGQHTSFPWSPMWFTHAHHSCMLANAAYSFMEISTFKNHFICTIVTNSRGCSGSKVVKPGTLAYDLQPQRQGRDNTAQSTTGWLCDNLEIVKPHYRWNAANCSGTWWLRNVHLMEQMRTLPTVSAHSRHKADISKHATDSWLICQYEMFGAAEIVKIICSQCKMQHKLIIR